MNYVIQLTEHNGKYPAGYYVADMHKSTSGGSYTSKLQLAKVFATREQAEREQCPGNERIVSVQQAMGSR